MSNEHGVSRSGSAGGQDFNVSEEEIDLLEYVHVIKQSKWMILACSLVFAALATLYAVLATPIYQVDALLQVEEKQGGLSGLTDLTSMFESSSPVEAEIEIIRSRLIMNSVVKTLHLDMNAKPHRFPIVGEVIARHYHGNTLAEPFLGLRSYAWGGEKIQLDRFDVDADWLGEAFVVLVKDSSHYQLLDSSGNLILNGEVGKPANEAGISMFISLMKAREGQRFDIAKQPIQEVAAALQEDLMISEKGKSTGMISLVYSSDDARLAMQVVDAVAHAYLRQNIERKSEEANRALGFLEKQLPEVRAHMRAAVGALNAYRLQQGSVDLTIETQAVLSQMVALDTKLSEFDLKHAELEQRFEGKHPLMKVLEQQRAQVLAERRALEKKVSALPQTEQKVLMLARDVKVNTELYTSLLDKSQELRVVKAGTIGNIRIIDLASLPLKPIKPKKSMIVALALFLGMFLGIIFAFIRKAMHQGVEDPDVIEQQLGLPLYANIPHSDMQTTLHDVMCNKAKYESSYMLAEVDGNDLAIESLRSLRTNIHFALLESKGNIIVLTGPSPGLGKSFVSANLAFTLADAGLKVLLVDGDMRKGYLHEYFSMERSPGLSGLLSEQVLLSDAIHATMHSNLSLLPTGVLPPNPSELLMSQNFDDFLTKASQDFDIVLIDTPPVLAVTDAVVIAKRASAVFLLLRFGKHPVREIKQTVTYLERGGIDVTGALLNDVALATAHGSYYGYHYQYEYGAQGKEKS